MINYTFTQYWEKFERALVALFEKYECQSSKNDDTYVHYHNCAMEMIRCGKKVESASLYNKYILGDQIKKTIKNAFTSKGVPKVNSDYTVEFAKLFMEHAQILAGGHVYSEQTLINMHLKLSRSTAENDILTLARRIKKYEAAKIDTGIQKTYCNSFDTHKTAVQQSSQVGSTQSTLIFDELNTLHSFSCKK